MHQKKYSRLLTSLQKCSDFCVVNIFVPGPTTSLFTSRDTAQYLAPGEISPSLAWLSMMKLLTSNPALENWRTPCQLSVKNTRNLLERRWRTRRKSPATGWSCLVWSRKCPGNSPASPAVKLS